jgi:hypothetical protein
MSQVLHIFRKDTRRFWIEILLSLAVAVALAVVYPGEWKAYHDPSQRMRVQQFARILNLLMSVSWLLLIARSVHAEPLVGDRQFWITRPYEWGKLLAAKVLFLTVWIGVPYVLTQTYLVAAAGFHPLPYVAGVLGSLALLATVSLLPIFSLAAVTSNFARLTLTVLGCFILLFVFSYLVYGTQYMYVSSNPYSNVFRYPLLFAGCAAAITLQYATRRTWLARGLLMVVAVLIALSVFAYRRQALVNKAYPRPDSNAAALVNFASTPNEKYPVKARSWDGQDYIDMPIAYSGVADGYAVFFEDVKYTLTAADGSQWTSRWQQYQETILPGTHYGGLYLPAISPADYDKFKSGPVTLRVTFAASRYRADAVMQTAFPGRDAAVPGIGFCSAENFYRPASIYCRAPLRGPQLTHLTAQWSKTPCGESSAAAADAKGQASTWIQHDGPDFSIVSVWSQTSYLRFEGDEDVRHGQVCEGTPMTVTQYRLVDRTQIDFILQNFVLPAKVKAT